MARLNVYEVDVTYFQQINTPSKAYWLGALAADGCFYYNRNKWLLQFIVSEKDQLCFKAFNLFSPNNALSHPIRCGFTAMCGGGQFGEIDKSVA